jgi:flagellar hook-basal body complex protein FliE
VAQSSFGHGTSGASAFAQLLEHGVDSVNQKLAKAETLAKAFALDDSVPIQQVTLALQEARMSLEFVLQVRTRLVDAYQQFAQMQL